LERAFFGHLSFSEKERCRGAGAQRRKEIPAFAGMTSEALAFAGMTPLLG
jgi:hypothetical protein